MNKKILIAALLCIALQLLMISMYYFKLFESGSRSQILFISSIMHFIAIPIALYQLFTPKNNVRQYKNIYNVIGVICTFPVLSAIYVICMLLLYGPSSQEEDIDSETINLYDADGNSIPKDSLLQRLKEDSTAIHRISIQDSTE